jgi:hypothetical protein
VLQHWASVTSRNHGRLGGNLAVFWPEKHSVAEKARAPLWQNVV